jgi:S-adenosylhomocysteine hydrolase
MTGTDGLDWRLGIGRTRSLDIVGMPLLDHFVAELGSRLLAGTEILYVNHLISDSLMVARAFRRLGARLTSIAIPYSGIYGPVQRAVHEGFKHLGPTFLPRVSHPDQFPAAMAVAVGRAIAHVTADLPAGGRWMIVEDGGYAFPTLHDDPTLRPHLASCIGAVEHTTRGKLNDQYLETDATPTTPRQLQRPAVTIAGSQLKTAHEGGFVAQALVDECGVLLRKDHQFLRYRPVVVVGYGRIGRALANQLHRLEATVMVADPNLPATHVEYPAVGLAEALGRGVFLVFGATGVPSMTPTDLGVFLRNPDQDLLYLASASSKQIEFSQILAFFQQTRTDPHLLRKVAGRDGRVRCELDPAVGLRYRVELAGGTVKTCVLLAHGYPVIFFPPDTHGAPNRAMDPVMTQLLLAACGLPDGHTSLDRRVYTVDDLNDLGELPPPWRALVDETGLLRRWCHHNGLDPGRYLRRIGFLEPQHRPAATSATTAGAGGHAG